MITHSMPTAEAVEIKSGEPEIVEAAIADLFDLARVSIIMSAGYPEFYGREKVRKSMESAANRVSSFKIILDDYVEVQRTKEKEPWLFELAARGKIQITKSNHQIPHWILVDDKHYRLEEPHPQTEAGRSNLIVRDADTTEETKAVLAKISSQLAEFLRDSTPVV